MATGTVAGSVRLNQLYEMQVTASAATIGILAYLVHRAHECDKCPGCGKPRGVAWPTQTTIAKAFGLQVRQVQNHLDELVDLGLIRKVKKGRGVGYQMWFTLAGHTQSTAPVRRGHTQSVTSSHAIRYASDTQSIAPPSEREGKERNDPAECVHIPVDDEGYCTACRTTLEEREELVNAVA